MGHVGVGGGGSSANAGNTEGGPGRKETPRKGGASAGRGLDGSGSESAGGEPDGPGSISVGGGSGRPESGSAKQARAFAAANCASDLACLSDHSPPV